MTDLYDIAQSGRVFAGIDGTAIKEAVVAMGAYEKTYSAGDTIIAVGDAVYDMGLVVAGSLRMEDTDESGKPVVVDRVPAGSFFYEAQALVRNTRSPYRIVCETDCRILFLRIAKLLSGNYDGAPWYPGLMRNLLAVSSEKSLRLSYLDYHTTPKTIRSRVIAYLRQVSANAGSREITIPYNRQQMADYLHLDRTALSKELGKMQDEGLITFKKNRFTLNI